MTTIDFTRTIVSLLSAAGAPSALRAYLEPGRFTGSLFEVFADSDPYTITASDLVAVSMLSVTIPAPTAAWLLGEGRPLVSSLLRQIPVDAHLGDPGILVGKGSAVLDL